MSAFFARLAERTAAATGSPWAFLMAAGIVATWAIAGPFLHFSEAWQLTINTGTTIITFLMVFLIQNGANRDTSEIKALLHGLVRDLAEVDDAAIAAQIEQEC